MNHDPNCCESFDPLLTVYQKHDKHHSTFRDTYIQNNGLVMCVWGGNLLCESMCNNQFLGFLAPAFKPNAQITS